MIEKLPSETSGFPRSSKQNKTKHEALDFHLISNIMLLVGIVFLELKKQ